MNQRKFFITLVILVALFTAFIVTGALSSTTYEGELSEVLVDRSKEVWGNLTDVNLISRRKPDVVSVDILVVERGSIIWRENLKRGGYRMMRIVERDAPHHLVIEQFKSSYGITGTWEYNLVQDEEYTIVTITEKSTTLNIWLRAWYTIIGRDILLDRELKSLRVSLFQRLLTTE